MMKLRIVALQPKNKDLDELEVNEKSWRPIRSLLAIANKRTQEDIGYLPVPFDVMEDLDDNSGGEVEESVACDMLATEMRRVIADPFAVVDYGMTVNIEDGITWYTYPPQLCTAYLEDEENGKFYETINDDGIVGRKVRSWFRASEAELLEFISFLENCGGFYMP